MSSLPRLTGAFCGAVAAALLLVTASGPHLLAQQSIVVESAVPSAAEQATVNLNVSIKGKGFRRGARARFLVTGTENPGGVTVNATQYVSSSEVIANIDVAADAALATFDIEIANDDDRTGKGTELFAVTSPGGNSPQAACTPLGVPANFSLAARLNGADAGGVPIFGDRFGMNAEATRFDAVLSSGSRAVMLLAVGTRNSTDVSRIEIFHVDPATGTRLDGIGADPQPHQTLIAPIVDFAPNALAWGDVNHDGAPDLIAGSQNANAAYGFIGSVSSGVLTFSTAIPIPKPAGRERFAWNVAVGDFDGNAGDEVALGANGGGSGKNAEPPRAFLYSYNGAAFVLRRTLAPSVTPALKTDDGYGGQLASGDVNGDGASDLIVGVYNREVSSVTDAGAVFVHTGPLLPATVGNPDPPLTTRILTASTPTKNDQLGVDVQVGDVTNDGIADVVIGTKTRAFVFAGPVTGNSSMPVASYTMTPEAGLDGGWPGRDIEVGDVTGDSRRDVVIGAPNASRNSSCNSPGVTYAFLADSATAALTRYRLEAHEPNDGFAAYGWSVALVDGLRILAIGEHHRRINGIEAGQVYLYIASDTPP